MTRVLVAAVMPSWPPAVVSESAQRSDLASGFSAGGDADAQSKGIRMRSFHLLVVLMSLLLAACGGGNEIAGDAAAQPPATSGVGDGDGGSAGSDDCTSGMACADGLIDELAAFPVPDSVDEFSRGSADLGGTGQAVQSLFFNASPSEVAAFYEEALPEAGFEVSPRETHNQDDYQWDLVSPDGQEGSIWIRGAHSHPAQAQFTLQVSG